MHTSTGNYTERITEKIIVSGSEVEYYRYKDKPIIRNYKRKNRKTKNDKVKQTKKSDFAVNRTRRDIRRTVNANPQLIKFLTLTSTSTNIDKMSKCFNLFTQRMEDRYSEFQYFSVREFQKDVDFFGKAKPDGGAIHYHLLCNLRYVKSKELEKIWGHGFIKIKKVKHVDNLGRYLSKYLQKDMFDKRMFGKKKFFCSQNLKRQTEIINTDAQDFLKNNSQNLKMTWEKTFTDDYRGEIDYKIYHSKNHKPLPLADNPSKL
jgi:hypothetical protein